MIVIADEINSVFFHGDILEIRFAITV